MNSLSRWRQSRPLAHIESLLVALQEKVDHIMTTEADLAGKLDKLATDIAAAVSATQASIADLKAQIATLQANVPVTQAQLDQLSAQADAIDQAVQPLVPPAPAPTA